MQRKSVLLSFKTTEKRLWVEMNPCKSELTSTIEDIGKSELVCFPNDHYLSLVYYILLPRHCFSVIMEVKTHEKPRVHQIPDYMEYHLVISHNLYDVQICPMKEKLNLMILHSITLQPSNMKF